MLIILHAILDSLLGLGLPPISDVACFHPCCGLLMRMLLLNGARLVFALLVNALTGSGVLMLYH